MDSFVYLRRHQHPQDLDRVKETSGNSIRALKHKVAERCGESVYRIKLVSFDGRYLQDDDLLTDVQLTDKERDVQARNGINADDCCCRSSVDLMWFDSKGCWCQLGVRSLRFGCCKRDCWFLDDSLIAPEGETGLVQPSHCWFSSQVPLDLQMLLQEFLPPSDEERVQFLVAASSGDAATLDTLLCKPMDPNTTIPFSEKKEMPTRQLWETTGLAPHQLGSSALQLACVGGHTDCARHGKTREKNWSALLLTAQSFKDEVEMYIYPSLSIIIHL